MINFKLNPVCKMKAINHRKVIILFLSIIFITSAYSQKTNNMADDNPRKASITLIARADVDSVVLRWAPTTPGGWVLANQTGYIVEKVHVPSDNSFQGTGYVRLNDLPLKPLELEKWKASASKDNNFSAIAAQAVYGKTFIPRPLDQNNVNVLKNAADELSNRYSFALFAADNDAFTANSLGLRWVDHNVKKDSIYIYRVFLAQPVADYIFDTAYLVISIKPYSKYPAPVDLRFESGDGNLKLFWKEKEPFYYSGFYVYRSDDGGKNFKKLNNMPLITATPKEAEGEASPHYIDTLTVNYRQYKYRIVGVSPFGELSEAAEITAFSKDLTPPSAPIIKKPKQISGRNVKITWEYNNPPADFKGFVISRSVNSLHGYQLITPKPLSAKAREYIDDLSGYEEMYYTVAAVDTAGNLAFSLPVLATRIDTVPPLPPSGLSGKIDEKGVVTLKWNLGKEKNLIGYRVLRANSPDHEFAQLTGRVHSDTVFIDTVNIKTLTRYVYYRVAAVNNRYQHSELTPVLTLRRPDIIPPVEAVFADVYVTDSSVQMKWHPSSSEDLAKQVLLRKETDAKNWAVIDSLPPTLALYIDKKVEQNKVYAYTIISVDSSGLKSKPAAEVVARPFDTGKRLPVSNFTAEYTEKDKNIMLKWNYKPRENEKTWYVIYRAEGDGQLKEYKSVDGNTFTFSDKNIPGSSYKYGIVVMTSFGGESEMKTASVIIRK
jgi:fibronectin type 3 domain-containing protein